MSSGHPFWHCQRVSVASDRVSTSRPLAFREENLIEAFNGRSEPMSSSSTVMIAHPRHRHRKPYGAAARSALDRWQRPAYRFWQPGLRFDDPIPVTVRRRDGGANEEGKTRLCIGGSPISPRRRRTWFATARGYRLGMTRRLIFSRRRPEE